MLDIGYFLDIQDKMSRKLNIQTQIMFNVGDFMSQLQRGLAGWCRKLLQRLEFGPRMSLPRRLREKGQ